MILDIENLSKDFLKNIEDCRVPNMHLVNHGAPLDNAFMERMLTNAKESSRLIDLSKWEKDNSNES